MMYYLALQYSGVQKTVLRHDRLWSISGLSQILSHLNEIQMREIVKKYGGDVLIAGGGKLSARFQTEDNAKKAREELVKLVSTTLPMLEFQISKVVQADSFKGAQETIIEGSLYPGLIHELSERKNCFRGYGVTYNPHFSACEECEEYPLERGLEIGEKIVCRVCDAAKKSAFIDLDDLYKKDEKRLSSMERIYRDYLKPFDSVRNLNVPMNMEDMFAEKNDKSEESRQWMAVWMSDINNMNNRVELWNLQEEEKILETYDKLKQLFIDSVVETLRRVFPKEAFVERKKDKFIPFRLIVAGGDDLCIVMPHKYIIDFTLKYSEALNNRVREIGNYHPTLTKEWLEEMAKKTEKDISQLGEISFGGAFVVTPIHTPFTRIHSAGEELMSEAKKKTGRIGNSINWQILGLEEARNYDEAIKEREKPLLVDSPYNGNLSFRDYVSLSKKYSKISKSQIFSIVEGISETHGDGERLRRLILRFPDARKSDSPIAQILEDGNLYKNGSLSAERLLTMFEIMTLMKGESDQG